VLRFGTDGVRGEALTQLTTADVAELGRAAAQVLGGDQWLIGRDTRESGEALERALAAGLAAGGAQVVSLGVVPTPAVAHAGAVRGLPTAVITASHNPYTDNGVKFFAPGGRKLPTDIESRIEAVMSARSGPTPLDAVATPQFDASGARSYVDHIVGLFPPGGLVGLRLVVDCANGAMSEAAPSAARMLGADVEVIHAAPNGRNINDRCGATHPHDLSAAVVESGSHLGLAFDGDGDRLIAVDHRGTIVDGDRLLALAALQLRELGELTNHTVVVTVMSNLGFHRAMQAAGIEVVTTPVGDRSVLEALEAGDHALGGEQSGHIIYRHLATTGDGLLAGLRLAQHVHDHHRPLAELAAEVMHRYPQVLVNVRVRGTHPHVADELAAEIADCEQSLGGEGRVLVRASGTEPLIRVMVEAPTAEVAQSVADRLAAATHARYG
jgi:phosphoglucosamine mutase